MMMDGRAGLAGRFRSLVRMRRALLLAAAALSSLAGGPARAGELVIFTGGAMLGPLKAASADFAKAGGAHLSFISGPTGMISNRLRGGAQGDVVVVTKEAMAALQAAGLTTSSPPLPLATAVIGAAIKNGARKPDLSSLEQFRRTLLDAKSIAYPDPKLATTVGIFLESLFDQLGVGEKVRAKAMLEPNGTATAAAVAAGHADLGLTFISEMRADVGVQVIGPLPGTAGDPTVFVAAVLKSAADPATARAFIDAIASPAEEGALLKAGVTPAPH